MTRTDEALTVGSLFSGIGGLELGLERAGMVTRWQVEREPYCRAVLAKHWPDVARFDDVCTVGAHNLPPVDVICGGFPCTDISLAKTHDSGGRFTGIGLEGARSGLWYEMLRVVREMGPRYVIVENSSALVARGLDAVLGGLAESGYDAEWAPIRAADLGAPHFRERTFVVAYPHGVGRLQAGELLGRIARQAIPRSSEWELGGAVRGDHGKTAIPIALGLDDGIPRGMDDAAAIAAFGNAVVPQVAEYIGRLIVAADTHHIVARAA